MKHFQPFFILMLALSIFTNSACNDPTVIGSDLLTGAELDIDFTDTITLRAHNEFVDSIATYIPDQFNSGIFPVGNFEDPIFGMTNSSVYSEVTMNFTFPLFSPPVSEMDSVVLTLPYQSNRVYGDTSEVISLEVYEITEEFPESTLYSNQGYAVGNLIGKVDFVPFPNKPVVLRLPGEDTTTTLPPHVRIPLNENNFDVDFFNADPAVFDSLALFEEFFKGFYVKAVSTNRGMLNFSFKSNDAGIRVFYHEDTAFLNYQFPVFPNSIVAAQFNHDYDGSIDMDSFVGEDAEYTDSLLFLQGMSGTDFVLEVPYATSLQDKLVNKAEIELPILFLSEDDPVFSPAAQIIVSEILEDGTLRVIDDVLLGNSRPGAGDFNRVFGGIVESDNVYRLNISSHFQSMVRGGATTKMVITVSPKPGQSARVIIGGPQNGFSAAKLNLTFTNL